jgi:precorrin-6Y C5,15-methyltransferase (decarboxylating)
VRTFARPGQATSPVYRPDDVATAIAAAPEQRHAVLVSGDAGFYSAAAALTVALAAYDPLVIPGLSTVNYFFARLRRPWQEAALVSCHGISADLTASVRRQAVTFALTGNNVPQLAEQLVAAGFGALPVAVGQNLSLPDESITQTTVADLRHLATTPLTVLVIDNPAPDDRLRSGIPDEEFERTDIPMTKAEVRAVILSKLALRSSDMVFDIGCGTGSVTVELALAAFRGHVYSFDHNPEAVALTRRNLARFHISNATVIQGQAPAVLQDLPVPEAAFIGGTSGGLSAIIERLVATNPQVRLAVTAILLESATAAIDAVAAAGFKPELVQLSIARTRPTAAGHMLIAQNPICLITGSRHA